jgi:hypothetical protein
MSKPVTIVLLGPDRVGKSTIVANTVNDLRKKDLDVKELHFSGMRPHHHTPIEQYIEPFNNAIEDMAEVIVCDRGFSEVCFYDKFRRNIEISEEWAQSAESYFSAYSSSLHVFLVKRPWEWSLPFHIEEIEFLSRGSDMSKFAKALQLDNRRREHDAYYDYMEEYLAHRSLLRCVKKISPTDPMFSLAYLV